jgi:hypothetical protein
LGNPAMRPSILITWVVFFGLAIVARVSPIVSTCRYVAYEDTVFGLIVCSDLCFWEKAHGRRPKHLAFDSKLTSWHLNRRRAFVARWFQLLRRAGR